MGKKKEPTWGGARPRAGRPQKRDNPARLSVLIEKATLDHLDRACAVEGCTRADITQAALEQYLATLPGPPES